jgi:hypothetical protein
MAMGVYIVQLVRTAVISTLVGMEVMAAPRVAKTSITRPAGAAINTSCSSCPLWIGVISAAGVFSVNAASVHKITTLYATNTYASTYYK